MMRLSSNSIAVRGAGRERGGPGGGVTRAAGGGGGGGGGGGSPGGGGEGPGGVPRPPVGDGGGGPGGHAAGLVDRDVQRRGLGVARHQGGVDRHLGLPAVRRDEGEAQPLDQ